MGMLEDEFERIMTHTRATCAEFGEDMNAEQEDALRAIFFTGAFVISSLYERFAANDDTRSLSAVILELNEFQRNAQAMGMTMVKKH